MKRALLFLFCALMSTRCAERVCKEVKVSNIIGSLSNAMDRVMVGLFAHVGKM